MKDKRLDEMKKDYETIRIPENLRQTVEAGIQQAKADREEEKKRMKKEKMVLFTKRMAGSVVAAMAAITIMANSGAMIAYAMYEVPVLGAIAEIVTFREYEKTVNDMEANVAIPEVDVKNEDGTVNEESTEEINQSIEEYTSEIIAQFEADVEEAGGDGKLAVDVDYSVVTDNDRLFSLRFDQEIIMASGSQTVKIYHMDKQTGNLIDLAGIFKEGVNFIDPISENIKEQMRAQMAADEMVAYWLDDELLEDENFEGITGEENFYVNAAKNLVIVFDEYEVAPGYMGAVEFEIPAEVVQDLVQEGILS